MEGQKYHEYEGIYRRGGVRAASHTYNRYQIVWEKGDGMYLYDIEGRKYLDFVAGIAVFALGYNNKAYNDALKAQIDKGDSHVKLLL